MNISPTGPKFRGALLASLLLFTALLVGCAASRPYAADSSENIAEPAMQAGEVAAAEPVVDGIQRKIIGKAWLELIVEDVDATVQNIDALMQELGGYVSTANLYRSQYDGSDALQGTLTLRVPAADLDLAMNRLESVALDVRSKRIDRQDVTDQYSDIEAQLRNLEATEHELRELLAEVRAKPDATAEDILVVHRSLTEVRQEIEQLQGRKNMMDNLVGMSTIEVTLIPDVINRPVVEAGWRPGVVARNATRALVSTMQLLGDIIIWVAVFVLPLIILALIPLALIIWAVRWLLRRLDRYHSKSVAQRPKASPEK